MGYRTNQLEGARGSINPWKCSVWGRNVSPESRLISLFGTAMGPSQSVLCICICCLLLLHAILRIINKHILFEQDNLILCGLVVFEESQISYLKKLTKIISISLDLALSSSQFCLKHMTTLELGYVFFGRDAIIIRSVMQHVQNKTYIIRKSQLLATKES